MIRDIYNITQEEYNKIIDLHKNGKIVLYIDNASFRQLFCDNNSKNIVKTTNTSILFQSIIISLLFYIIPIYIIALSIITVYSFSWWSFIVLPLFLYIWFIVHSRASYGKQSIVLSIFISILIIAVSIFYIYEINIGIADSLILFSILVFNSKLLYFLTSKFAFDLLLKNYKFFAILYETKYNLKSFTAMVWVDSLDNYLQIEQVKKSIHNRTLKEIFNITFNHNNKT